MNVLDHDEDTRRALKSFSTDDLFDELGRHLDDEIVSIDVLPANFPKEMVKVAYTMAEMTSVYAHANGYPQIAKHITPLFSILGAARDALESLETRRNATAHVVHELRRRIEEDSITRRERG